MEILDISTQLCGILVFLHNPTRPILHLDIKPENLLFVDRNLKLIDFGSAICRNQQKEGQLIFGTPAYCAPEMKNMGILTEQTDIYCMGKCMEYLLFHTPKAPKGYRNIVERCLRKRGKEYISAEQVLKDLERLRRKKTEEKNRETWYAVTGVNSEHDSSMAALQLAMYLRDRYNKPVLYLDCTKGHWMEQLEQSEKSIKSGDSKGFVFERNKITVAKRVAPQEISGWRDRGYANIVICFGTDSPLSSVCPFKLCICAGAVTEFCLEQWNKLLLALSRKEKVAVALTGGDIHLAKKQLLRFGTVVKLPLYFRAFKQSKPFKREMKKLLNGR